MCMAFAPQPMEGNKTTTYERDTKKQHLLKEDVKTYG